MLIFVFIRRIKTPQKLDKLFHAQIHDNLIQ